MSKFLGGRPPRFSKVGVPTPATPVGNAPVWYRYYSVILFAIISVAPPVTEKKVTPYSIPFRTQVRIQGMGAGAGAHPWDGDAPLKIYLSIAFKHQFIIGRHPPGEILYPPLERLSKTLNNLLCLW